MWTALLICSLALSLALAKDCPPILFPGSEYCCDDSDLGCFTQDPPHDTFPLPCCYDDTEVTFSLYTRDNKDKAVMIRKDEPIPSEWSKDRRTVFASHGWLFPMYEQYGEMKDAFLDKDDFNVVVMDWPSWRANYFLSASETRTVGKLISVVMKKLVEEGGTTFDDIWCVGHSLGAHICGFAGRGTDGKIGRITGLDPAGPLFEKDLLLTEGQEDVMVGLNSADAQYVDIIHTDTPTQGTVRPLGHIDFYVNGLNKQPGCLITKRKRDLMDDFRRATGCSHARAVDYFIESIPTDCFVSREKCTDVNDMPGSCSPCEDDVCTTMGYKVSGDNGIYYLQTNEKAPFCQG